MLCQFAVNTMASYYMHPYYSFMAICFGLPSDIFSQYFDQHLSLPYSVPQLERCSKGGKISFRRGQNFWVGLLFYEFSGDLKKTKTGHRTELVDFSPSSLLISNQKRYHLETAARVKEVWVGILGSLGRRNFCLGGTAPFCPPLVAALTVLDHHLRHQN